jgi:MFS family permease
MLRGARWAASVFLLYGIILGTWTSRIPAIKAHLQLSDARLSFGLLSFAGGAIVGMQVAGWLVDRLGARAVLMPAVFLDAAALVAPAYANSLWLLVVALLVFGVLHGTLNVAMNVNAVQVQQALGRPIISSCHAIYSIGGFVGAATGGLFAYEAAGARATFVSVGVVVAVAAVAVTRSMPMAPAGAAPAGAALREAGGPARVSGVAFLGVLAFCCLVGEGAAADWSAVYLRDSLGTSAGYAASAYACFAVMMTAGRLVGDRLVLRYGAADVARAGGTLAAVGLALCLLVSAPVAGVVGFGCLGAGLSSIAPQVFAAAGNRNPGHAGAAIGRVAGLGFIGFVVGPVVIGAVASLVGLAWALVLPAVLAGFVALSAGALRASAISVPEYPETTRQE